METRGCARSVGGFGMALGDWREKGMEGVDEREEMKRERLQVQGERRRASVAK